MKDQENIVLMDENGKEEEFEVIATLSIDENEYAILLPVSDGEELEDSAYIFRIDKEDGEDLLVPIEDDDEFEAVREEYERLMEEEE